MITTSILVIGRTMASIKHDGKKIKFLMFKLILVNNFCVYLRAHAAAQAPVIK
jgi:hypothetical protein